MTDPMPHGTLAAARWLRACERPMKRLQLAIVARLDRAVLDTSPKVP